MTKQTFINKAKQVHGNKYDYSKVNYINYRTKVCIICPEHGEFWQLPGTHLRGSGCKKCGVDNMAKKHLSHTDEFIKKAKIIFGDSYDYTDVIYKKSCEKVKIKCKKCGNDFLIRPNTHLAGQGCPICAGTKRGRPKKTLLEFILKARSVHGDKYDYSKTDLNNCDSKGRVCIICPEHGEFWQLPSNHLRGYNCPACTNNQNLTTSDFIEKAKKIHDGKYDYSKTEYVNNKTKVCIICPEHGEFWQTPTNHLIGHGCPHCKESKLEKEINDFLTGQNFNFIRHYKAKWLDRQHLDFYLPDYNIAIECQGRQHFELVDVFGGIKGFIKNMERDALKQKKCAKQGIEILYYAPKSFDCQYNIITNKNDLLDILKRNKR